jgi:Na+/H+ antiporter
VPRRVGILLEGESLVNDATAIVAYRVAVMAVLSGTFSVWHAGGRFLLVAAGGVVIGYLAGRLVAWVRPRVRDGAVEGMVSLLTPYVAYLPAEWVGASGVLAVVTAGVYVGRRLPRITTSQTRLRLFSVWDTLVFLLNGMVFILIGLQLPVILANLRAYPMPTLIGYAALVTLACVVARLMWVFPATYLPRALLPGLRSRDPAAPFPAVFLVAWVGLRGIVSLAAALALPFTLSDRVTPFPGRDLILFLTFGVIVGTLVLQGLTLPAVIRALGIRQTGTDPEQEYEEALARLETAHAALARLEVLGFTNEQAADLIARVRVHYEERVRYLAASVRAAGNGAGSAGDGSGAAGSGESPFAAPCRTTDEVQRLAIIAEREMLVRLRDDGTIGDEVLRRIQQELDLEESRLTANDEGG